MGTAFETFLTFVAPVVAIIVVLIYSFRKELSRLGRFLRAWQTEDAIEENLSASARREVDEALGPVQEVDHIHG